MADVELIVGTRPASVVIIGASLVCMMVAELLPALATVIGAPLGRERD